jgi:hypothetical protein
MWDNYRRNSKGWRADSFAIIHPRIILGSSINVDLHTIASHGITHVVNCAEDICGSKWFKNEWPDRYAYISAIDNENEDITSWYPAFEQVMNTFLASKDCKNIYVHCECGINRSAFLLLMYSCIKFRYSIESTVKNILLQRPCCFTNQAFRKQAIEYIKKHG